MRGVILPCIRSSSLASLGTPAFSEDYTNLNWTPVQPRSHVRFQRMPLAKTWRAEPTSSMAAHAGRPETVRAARDANDEYDLGEPNGRIGTRDLRAGDLRIR